MFWNDGWEWEESLDFNRFVVVFFAFVTSVCLHLAEQPMTVISLTDGLGRANICRQGSTTADGAGYTAETRASDAHQCRSTTNSFFFFVAVDSRSFERQSKVFVQILAILAVMARHSSISGSRSGKQLDPSVLDWSRALIYIYCVFQNGHTHGSHRHIAVLFMLVSGVHSEEAFHTRAILFREFDARTISCRHKEIGGLESMMTKLTWTLVDSHTLPDV